MVTNLCKLSDERCWVGRHLVTSHSGALWSGQGALLPRHALVLLGRVQDVVPEVGEAWHHLKLLQDLGLDDPDAAALGAQLLQLLVVGDFLKKLG